MKGLPRRRFLASLSTAGLAGFVPVPGLRAQGPVTDPERLADRAPLIVSTWPFGKPANERALEVLRAGGSGLDAVERGINLTESDPANASVGLA